MERELNPDIRANSAGHPETDTAALHADVESLRQALDQFINGTSHDLRGPLDQVQALVGLLVRKYKASLNEDAQALCGHIEAAAERASQVLEALQEYARISEPIRLEMVASETLLKAALYTCEAALRRSGAEVSNATLPIICADPQKFIRLFEELLGNAVKFRGSHPLEVEIGCTQRGEFFEFSVRDNGPGIPADKAKSVFEAFKRLHGYDYPGTGIGLAICQRIIEMHGGRIWVEAGLEGGADFRFTLPIREAGTG